jgi:hypothetical protein
MCTLIQLATSTSDLPSLHILTTRLKSILGDWQLEQSDVQEIANFPHVEVHVEHVTARH